MIECPICLKYFHQITNSHVRSKHPEFASPRELCDAYGIEIWSTETKTKTSASRAGATRGKYNLTEAFFEGKRKAARSGKEHWNYGNHLSATAKSKISKSVKKSDRFNSYLSRLASDPVYKTFVNDQIRKATPRALATRMNNGNIRRPEDKTNMELYYTEIHRRTRQNYRKWKHLIDPQGLIDLKEYELDHMVSQFAGFLLDIPPWVIASPANLMPLPRSENRRKRARCSLTEQSLSSRILVFNSLFESKTTETDETWEPKAVFTGLRLRHGISYDLYDLPNDIVPLIPKLRALFIRKT